MPEKGLPEKIFVGFEAGRARRRAVRMLAAKLDYDSVSELIRALLDKEIAKQLPEEFREIEAEDLKARSRRQAKRKAG